MAACFHLTTQRLFFEDTHHYERRQSLYEHDYFTGRRYPTFDLRGACFGLCSDTLRLLCFRTPGHPTDWEPSSMYFSRSWFRGGRPKVDNSRFWTISPRTTRKHLLEFQAGAYTILSSHQATPASPRLRRTDAPLFTFLTIHMTFQDTRGHLTAPCLLLCVDYRYILCIFRFWPTPGKLMSCWIPWLHLHADHGGSTSSQCERKDSERSRLCLGSCRLERGAVWLTARLTLTEVARRAALAQRSSSTGPLFDSHRQAALKLPRAGEPGHRSSYRAVSGLPFRQLQVQGWTKIAKEEQMCITG